MKIIRYKRSNDTFLYKEYSSFFKKDVWVHITFYQFIFWMLTLLLITRTEFKEYLEYVNSILFFLNLDSIITTFKIEKLLEFNLFEKMSSLMFVLIIILYLVFANISLIGINASIYIEIIDNFVALIKNKRNILIFFLVIYIIYFPLLFLGEHNIEKEIIRKLIYVIDIFILIVVFKHLYSSVKKIVLTSIGLIFVFFGGLQWESIKSVEDILLLFLIGFPSFLLVWYLIYFTFKSIIILVKMDHNSSILAKENIEIFCMKRKLEEVFKKKNNGTLKFSKMSNKNFKLFLKENKVTFINPILDIKNQKTKWIVDRNHFNLLNSCVLIFLFVVLASINSIITFANQQTLYLIIFILVFVRLISRSIEIGVSFYKDVISPSHFKNTFLDGSNRINLAIISLLEITILVALLYMVGELYRQPSLILSTEFLGMFFEFLYFFILSLFKSLAIAIFNFSFTGGIETYRLLDIALLMIHLIQVTISIILITLSIANYSGLSKRMVLYSLVEEKEQFTINKHVFLNNKMSRKITLSQSRDWNSLNSKLTQQWELQEITEQEFLEILSLIEEYR